MINLEKGQTFELTKEVPALKKVLVGLGWDVNDNGGAAFDLDAAAILFKADNTVKDVLFYNNKETNGLVHTGDNLTGEGDGDDEQILVDLDSVPADVERILVTVNIFQATARNQNFGMVNNAFIRVVNNESNEEICKYELGANYSTEKTVKIAEISRKDGEWTVTALGEGYQGEFGDLLKEIGAM